MSFFVTTIITLTFLSFGVNGQQQLGADNVTYVNGITTLDISRAVPTALLVTGTVIFQSIVVSVGLIALSHDPPKKDSPPEKPATESPTEKPAEPTTEKPQEFTYPPYYVYNQDDSIPYELEEENVPYDSSLPQDNTIQFPGYDVQSDDLASPGNESESSKEADIEPQVVTEAFKLEEAYDPDIPIYYSNDQFGDPYNDGYQNRFGVHQYRYRRSSEEQNIIDMLERTETFDCYSRLICAIASGNLLTPKFEILPDIFLTTTGFHPKEFGYKYTVAANLGKATKSVDVCDQRYSCPVTQADFKKLLREEPL